VTPFVGCHANPVYPAVTWIPIYVSVTSSPVFPPCGMFPSKAPTVFFPSGFSTNNLYLFLFSPIHATCPTHRSLLHFIILIILGKKYKSRNSSLCSFLHPPITSFLFGQNILNTLFSHILSLCSSLQRPSFTPIQNNRENYSPVYSNSYIL
jgi:hypothetical protein